MCLLSFGAAARCGVSGSLLLFIYGLVLHSQSANSLATECTECHRVIVEPNGHTSKTWRKQKTTVLFLWPYNGHRQRTTQSHSGWNIFLYTLIQRSPHYCVWYMMISDLLRLKTFSLVFASQSYSNFQKHWGHCVGRQTQWRNFWSCQISSSLLLKACRDGAIEVVYGESAWLKGARNFWEHCGTTHTAAKAIWTLFAASFGLPVVSENHEAFIFSE